MSFRVSLGATVRNYDSASREESSKCLSGCSLLFSRNLFWKPPIQNDRANHICALETDLDSDHGVLLKKRELFRRSGGRDDRRLTKPRNFTANGRPCDEFHICGVVGDSVDSKRIRSVLYVVIYFAAVSHRCRSRAS
jgi:hypothetical protein